MHCAVAEVDLNLRRRDGKRAVARASAVVCALGRAREREADKTYLCPASVEETAKPSTKRTISAEVGGGKEAEGERRTVLNRPSHVRVVDTSSVSSVADHGPTTVPGVGGEEDLELGLFGWKAGEQQAQGGDVRQVVNGGRSEDV